MGTVQPNRILAFTRCILKDAHFEVSKPNRAKSRSGKTKFNLRVCLTANRATALIASIKSSEIGNCLTSWIKAWRSYAKFFLVETQEVRQLVFPDFLLDNFFMIFIRDSQLPCLPIVLSRC